MSELTLAVAMVAPYYNLGFTVIVVYLFIQLFRSYRQGQGVYLTPWAYIFSALMIFVIEELLTILRATGAIELPRHINGFFELVIISLFIYALLLQRDWVIQSYEQGSQGPLSVSLPKRRSGK